MDRAPFLTILGLAISVCADVLTLREVETYIYRDAESVSQRESQRESESVGV